ncbi:Piso0_003750 [Millerozyma farinosa CBS 7064]|uniref:Peptidyl-prolyl cis-trans isomerase n=1 Tax=Pichia sorbitophila (strain ATCC MYA-4447 / BCRC 22081 / CBS 7064 / NBRC 10061 / NRRL Y-12695) TaxID=559304 RepID=G8Y872_PICSO|nr:Piso0_003750 [Millerozyma farinosa CBS 7064]CCE84209.1 Piso0_003750 [Millerozyma farinosa CBS 7064]
MSIAETGLPPGWTIRVSRTHNTEYFLKQSTKESSWEPPFGTDKDKLKKYLERFNSNGKRPVVQEDGKVRASHLLVKHAQSRRPKSWKSPDGITRSRDEAIILMKQYRDRILKGETTLSELSSTESDCSSHSQGGDLGFFGRGQMQPAFEDAAFNMHVGELSDLVESDSGIHIIERTA